MKERPSNTKIATWVLIGLSLVVLFMCTGDDGQSLIRGSNEVRFFARLWVYIGPGVAIWLAITVHKVEETQQKLWRLESKYREKTGEWPT